MRSGNVQYTGNKWCHKSQNNVGTGMLWRNLTVEAILSG